MGVQKDRTSVCTWAPASLDTSNPEGGPVLPVVGEDGLNLQQPVLSGVGEDGLMPHACSQSSLGWGRMVQCLLSAASSSQGMRQSTYTQVISTCINTIRIFVSQTNLSLVVAMVASDLSASPAQLAQSHIPLTVASVTSGAASIDEQYLESQARRWLSQTLSRTLPADKPLSDLLGDGEILLELACLVQQLLAPDAPPSASVPLTPNFDSAPPAKPPTAPTAESGAFAAAAAAADAADGAAEGGVDVSAGGDRSSSSANWGRSSEESGGSGFKRAYWHACTNVERFLKVCRRVGLRDVSLFTSPDLVDGRDVRRVCLCLRTLSKRLVGIRDFDGIMVTASSAARQRLISSLRACLPACVLVLNCFSTGVSCPPYLLCICVHQDFDGIMVTASSAARQRLISSSSSASTSSFSSNPCVQPSSLAPSLADLTRAASITLPSTTSGAAAAVAAADAGAGNMKGPSKSEHKEQKQLTPATATESLDSEPPDSEVLSSTNREASLKCSQQPHAAQSENALAWFGLDEEERRSMAGAIPAGLPSLRVHGRPVGERVGGAMQPAEPAAPSVAALSAAAAPAGSARVRGQDWRADRPDAWHGGHEQRHVYHRHSQQHPSECDRVREARHEQHQKQEGHEQQRHGHHWYHQHTDQHSHASASEARQNSHHLSEYHRVLEPKQKQSGERHLGASGATAVPAAAAAGAGARAAAASAAPVDVSPRFLPPDPTSLTPVLPDHLCSPRRVASPISRTHSNASSTSTALHSTHSLSRHSHTRGSHHSRSHALGLVGEGEGEQRRRGVWDLVAAAGAVALAGKGLAPSCKLQSGVSSHYLTTPLCIALHRTAPALACRRALEYERPSFTDHIAQRPHLGMGFGGVFELNFGDTPVAAAATDAADGEGEGQEGSEGGRERGREGGRERGGEQVVREDGRTGLGGREARETQQEKGDRRSFAKCNCALCPPSSAVPSLAPYPSPSRPWFMSLSSQRNSTGQGSSSTSNSNGSSGGGSSSTCSGGWQRGPKPLPRWQQAELVLRQQREMVIRLIATVLCVLRSPPLPPCPPHPSPRRPWFMSLGSQRNSTGEARNTTSTTGSSSSSSSSSPTSTTSSSGGWRRGPKPLPRWQQAELVLRQQREMVIRRLHGDRRSMAEIWWVLMGADGCWWVLVGAGGKEESGEGREGGEVEGRAEGEVYEVQEGDTLSTIAHRSRRSVGEVLRRNPQIKDPDAIYPHDRLPLGEDRAGLGDGMACVIPSMVAEGKATEFTEQCCASWCLLVPLHQHGV
ncbi:unnamed protein product [Closterium sp. NIES-54]